MADQQEKRASLDTGTQGSESPEAAEARDGDKKQPKGREGEPESELTLEAALAKAEENYERLLRVTAEFENYKKRAEREMKDFKRYANESVIKEILPFVDNLERALASACDPGEKAMEGLRTGVEMTLNGLLATLKKFGVVPVEAKGKPFDPNLHHAVSREDSKEYPENSVCRELQKGYLLNDRLLRPSMVVVSCRPDAQGKDQDSEPCARKSQDQDSEPEGSEKKKVRITVH